MGSSRWSPLLLAALAFSTAAHAQSTYRLTRIDPGVNVEISDVNEKGEVVGAAFSEPFLPPRAFLLRDGMMIDLGDLGGGGFTLAGAINDLTQIVGASSVLGEQSFVAFLWESGQIRDLGVGARASSAADINNRGQIIGQSSVVIRGALVTRPFLWEQGRTTFLEAFGCPSPAPASAAASAINESGVIVGTFFPGPESRALIWQNGEVMALEPPFPLDFGEGIDVNDRNEAIGFYYKNCCSTPVVGLHCCNSATHTALLWQPEGEVAVLPLLDRSPDPQRLAPLRSFPESINDAGQIVGWTTFVDTDTNEEVGLGCCGGGNLALATLWQDGSVFDLNELVRDDDPAKPFVRLIIGLKITDSGLILARGQDTRVAEHGSPDYFLLTPDGTLPATAAPALPSSGSSSDSGGGVVDLLSLLLLILGLSSFARSQRGRFARPFG